MTNSNVPSGSRGPSLRGVLGVLLALSLAFTATPLVKAICKPTRHNKDYTLWYDTGRAVLEGRPLYPRNAAREFPYMYPPFTAVCILAPLARLGRVGMTAALLAANVGAWFASILLTIRLVQPRDAGTTRTVAVVSLLAASFYVWDTFLLGQPNLVLLALMLGGFVLLRDRRPLRAGLCFGLAIAIKAFPAPVIFYLAYRRRWRALIATCCFAAILLWGAPAPARGLALNAHEMMVWARGMLDPSGLKLGQRASAFGYANQSLFGLVHRLTRPLPIGADPSLDASDPLVNLVSFSPLESQAIVGAAAILAALAFAVRGASRSHTPDAAFASEAAAVLILIPLFSPIAWTYYFCWIMPAAAVVASIALDTRRTNRVRRRVAAVGIGAGLLLAGALTQLFDPFPQAYGVTTLGASFLAAVLLWAMGSPTDSPLPQPDPAEKLIPAAPAFE